MSIHIQCSGIVTLLILLFFQLRQRRTNLLTERVFRWVLGGALICLVLDVGSILAIRHAFGSGGAGQGFWVDLVCKGYLLSLIGIGLVTLLYICADAYYVRLKQLQRLVILYGSVGLVAMAVILALPIEYHKNAAGTVTNTDGPSVYAAYAFIAIYLVLIIFQLVWSRHRLNHHRRAAVTAWMILWVGAFAIQLLNNSLLLASMACSGGTLIIFLSLENPEANIDKQTGLFASPVLLSYLPQMYVTKTDFSAMLLIFDAPPGQPRGKQTAEDVRLELGHYIEGREWMVFSRSDTQFFFVFDTPQEARSAQAEVMERVHQRWPDPGAMPVKLHWILVPSAKAVDGDKQLLHLMRHLARKHYFHEDFLEVDDKLIREVRRDAHIEALLDAAIQQDRIEIFYQPIYSTRQRRITSAEALVRIRDEEGKLVPPGLFIPIAEANGMILTLGKLIFERVCRFIKLHPLDELGLSYIEVNLSVVQCASADLADDYIDIMRRYGISPKHINLEITESASTDEKKVLLKNMDQLIDYGASFSLDDFGTGQSNLNYIMDMPVEIAKFDRAMTQAYFVNDRAKQVMTAAIRMIHDMGLSIVSEGVETAEEYRTIKALGVEYIQGYYFSQPLPEEDFLDYIRGFLPPNEDEATA